VPAPGPDSLAAIGRRLLLAVVVGLLAPAVMPTAPVGAADTTTPDPCAGTPPTVAAHQSAFARIPGIGAGWTTADGYVPVALPDGRRAWLMSDTVVGPPAAAVAPATLVRNSIVVQRGRCFTPVMGGTASVRDDLVPELDGRACWQSAGFASESTLVVFCTDVEDADGPPGFGFRVIGTTIATFELPSLSFVDRVPLPFADTGGVQWGTGVVRRGDWVYVYGSGTGAQYVARVRADRVTSGPWKFWTGTAWGPLAAVRPMTFASDTPVMPTVVTPTADGFVAVGFARALPDPVIVGWAAAAPQGPWRPVGTVATAALRTGQFAYDARVVDLGTAGWAIVYNVNDPVAETLDSTAYGGRFVRAPPRLTGPRSGAGAGAAPRSP
jgi:hypothetical protein